MRILGIDTATSIASVALMQDGKIVAEHTHESSSRLPGVLKTNHAEIILPLAEAVLRDAGVALRELSGLAVSIGPGSFTGLRIGLSTVKGLAYGLDIPVVGISTLLANAARVENFPGVICSLLDARKNEVYAALFRCNGAALIRITEDRVAGAREIVELAGKWSGDAPCLFVGDGSVKYEKMVVDALGNRAVLRAGGEYASLASAVARLGGEQLYDDDGKLAALAPVYLRPVEAELKTLKQA